jgi:aminoglycoside phosphotransferase (APT) family kinase protein
LSRAALQELVDTMAQAAPGRWSKPAPVGLILGDPNPKNMIETGGVVRLVDWENSGWADPAFEIADLCACRDCAFELPDEHRVWLRAEHGRLLNDRLFTERAAIYERMMLVWWVCRASRYLVEAHTRLNGVLRLPPDYYLALQQRYWTTACAAFGLPAGDTH